MRSYRIILLVMLMPIVTLVSYAQCPNDEDELENGGTFSGNCSVAVGAIINIAGTVNWTSGTLTITGNSGRIRVLDGATINILAGSIVTVDNSNGPVDIRDGGTINVYSGASLVADERITVDGTFNVYGDVSSLSSGLTILSHGTVLISAGGDLTTTGSGDNLIQGSLRVEGNLSTTGDIQVDGGGMVIATYATASSEDGDLLFYNNGSILIEPEAVVQVGGDVANGFDPTPYTPSSGTLMVQGSLQIGEDVQIFNTTPNSQFLGTSSGQITVTGSVSDAECPTYSEGVYTFCDCTGGGEICSAVLPVELVSFTAVHQHGNVLLEWSTASELNNSHYTVERFNDLDQVIPLMDIPGKGTTTEMNHYRFMDTTPQVGDNYYRLKQVDLNGAFAYSAVVKTEVTLASQQLTLSINPNEPRFLSIKASGLKPQRRAPVSIVSADGGTCFFEYKTTTEAGNILEEIDTSTLTPGLYIVKVATLHAKFVK